MCNDASGLGVSVMRCDAHGILQVLVWKSLKKFCDERFPEQKFKNDAQRRSFLIKSGIKLQKDDTGREGVATPKSGEGGEEKEIKVGKRLAASKIKLMDYGDGTDFKKSDIADAHAKNAAGLHVAANDEDRVCWVAIACSMGS